MSGRHGARHRYSLGDIGPDEIPGLWYFCVAVEGKVVKNRQPNGVTLYMTYKSQAGAHQGCAKVLEFFPGAEVIAR